MTSGRETGHSAGSLTLCWRGAQLIYANHFRYSHASNTNVDWSLREQLPRGSLELHCSSEQASAAPVGGDRRLCRRRWRKSSVKLSNGQQCSHSNPTRRSANWSGGHARIFCGFLLAKFVREEFRSNIVRQAWWLLLSGKNTKSPRRNVPLLF